MLAMNLKLATALAAVPAQSTALPPLPKGGIFLKNGEHYLAVGNQYLVAAVTP